MKLDINTAIIPEDAQIWAMHAGKGKKYFKDFADGGLVFLDLPGFNFEEQIISNERDLEQNLLMSIAIRNFYKKGGNESELSRSPSNYHLDKENGDRLIADKYNVRRFFPK